MTAASLAKVEVPPHVPLDRVVDFDWFALPGLQSGPHAAWKKLQEQAPRIFWTPHYGGHWVATRAAEMAEIEKDYTIFSHTGISIPRSSIPSLPLESDPPLHTGLRAVISPLFAPPVLAKAQAHARTLMAQLVKTTAPHGSCEFVVDIAQHLPIAVFLDLTGLPQEDADFLVPIAGARVREADPAKRDAAKMELFGYLQKVIANRREKPGDDMLSKIIHSQVDDRDMTEYELLNVLATVMFGGLDTVASGLSYIMHFLATNEPVRNWLCAQPSISLAMVDELFRRHGIVNTARLVMRDINFAGLEMKEGEQILLPSALIGLDEERFESPMEVRFDRETIFAGTFGSGPHTCPGKNLGRMETKLALEEWLRHIPDFSLIKDRPARFDMGTSMTVAALPLQWVPSKK